MFDAVYVADSSNNLVFEYLAQLYSPHFKLLITTILSEQQSGASDIEDAKAFSLIHVNDDFFVCSRQENELIFFILCLTLAIKQSNPLLPFVFINRFIEVLKEYFGTPLTPTKFDANNDTLTLLLREMIEEGLPNITDTNNLRDLVLIKSFLSKILRTANETASAASNKSFASLSQLTLSQGNGSSSHNVDKETAPWRRANVKYTNNEMFVDVLEQVNVILRPKRTKAGAELLSIQNFDSAFYSSSLVPSSSTKLIPITGNITGQLDLLSHLSGSPSLQINLNLVASQLENTQFHRCVNSSNWQRSRNCLTFIPPDGHSTLMTYEIDLNTQTQKNALNMLGLFEFDLKDHLGINQNEFEARILILKSHGIQKIDKLQLDIFTQERHTSEFSEEASNSNEEENVIVDSIKSIKVTHGDFRYKGDGKAEWILKDLAAGTQPVLRASVLVKGNKTDFEDRSSAASLSESQPDDTSNSPISAQKLACAPIAYNASFIYKGGVPSGLKVESLKVVSNKGMGENVKPYKGVKYTTTTGNYAIRTQ